MSLNHLFWKPECPICGEEYSGDHCPGCYVRCEGCLNYFNREDLHPNIQTATYFLKFCCDRCLREEIEELNNPNCEYNESNQ